jgi:hypothetical protein
LLTASKANLTASGALAPICRKMASAREISWSLGTIYKQAQARGPEPARPEPLSVMAKRLGILRPL